jgi:uncharacterized protein (DUF1501 family)
MTAQKQENTMASRSHSQLVRGEARSTWSRREILKRGACGAAGLAGMHMLSNLGLISSAAAQGGPSDYKALVCVFLYGGNDSFNLLVPRDAAHYAVYQASRQGLAIPQASLLSITPLTSDGSQYGLHPACPELRMHFESGKLALIANVGSLLAPMTKTDYHNGTVARPPQLFSHSDQQFQWMTSIPDTIEGYGWAGRVAELLQSLNGTTPLSMNITLSGANTWQVGPQVIPYDLGTNGTKSLKGFWGNQGQRRQQAFQALLDKPNTHLFETAFADVQKRAIEIDALISSTLESAPPLATVFPSGSWLASQLAMVARMISIRGALGVHRQIFFCSTGGFDTHDHQTTDQPVLLANLSQALSAFQAAMAELGTETEVTTLTASDFGRTLSSNGHGTDHGWGGMHVVLGGSVRGQDVYGTYPNLALDGPDDVGGGRILPTTSVDEYSATLAKWFGVAASDMYTVFPHLDRFANPDLGFML